MKKLILGAAAALLISAASCSKDAEQPTVDKATTDSISTYYGLTRGGFVLSDFERFGEEHKTQQTKDDILKGIQLAFGAVKSEGMMMGVQIGTTMLQEIEELRAQGVDVDLDAVLKNFRTVFLSDSLDVDALRQDNSVYSALVQSLQEKAEEARRQEAAQAPEAKQNSIAGKAFIDKVKAENPDAKTTASGAVFVVKTAGDDSEIHDNSIVKINYVGKLIDGTVFDQNRDGQPASFSPAGVIPGLREALLQMSKGTVATVYIPGELAYGVDGVPQAGIGPNQTLVFDVEIIDVQNAQ
jgi:FKBP-type peptidyl-prolyl cis-trans isomerase